MTTVREMVKAIQAEMRDGELATQRACALLSRATSLIGNCNDEIRLADLAYSQCLLAQLQAHGKAAHARMAAEISPEYQRKREARDTKELLVELVRSLKYVLRAHEEEMRLGA